MIKHIGLLLTLALGLATPLTAQTIDEKRASIIAGASNELDPHIARELEWVNEEIARKHEQLGALQRTAQQLFESGAEEEAIGDVLAEMREERDQLWRLEGAWRARSSHLPKSEGYALWHQPWTTVEQLVMDYGCSDWVYIVPPEVASLRLSVTSNIPVPRESWNEMLLLILTQNGIGVRELSPLVRQLYLTRDKPGSISYVTDDRTQLEAVPPTSQVCFVLSVGLDAAAAAGFLRQFADPAVMRLEVVGSQCFVLGTAGQVQELLKVYDFVDGEISHKEYHIISLRKITGSEMERILDFAFVPEPPPEEYGGPSRLRVLSFSSMPYSLFLSGPPNLVEQAKKMIVGVEAGIQDPAEKVMYTYRVKHSEPEELADVLSYVYNLMIANALACDPCEDGGQNVEVNVASENQTEITRRGVDPGCFYADYACDPAIGINPQLVTTRVPVKHDDQPVAKGNFVVDPKTGTIIMVVEQEYLSRIKQLIWRLDVPKKMVKIEVLLFEKKVTDRTKFGLEKLRIGSCAENKANRAGFCFDGSEGLKDRGLVQFFVSQAKTSGFPAFDIQYDFLLDKEDIRINANPSVTTVNHTPALIQLVEEISIDNGTFIEPDTVNVLKRSFSRAQYGITLQITPNINTGDDEFLGGEVDFITLETDVIFDTPKPSLNDRPDVIRRKITNEVRIADGQTVIMGGLRSKMSEDQESGLPFIGEIPGIGKFFSFTKRTDRTTEMFIFITPRIIRDPCEELVRMRRELRCRRPGDTPDYLHMLIQARECARRRLFDGTLKAIFGDPCETCPIFR